MGTGVTFSLLPPNMTTVATLLFKSVCYTNYIKLYNPQMPIINLVVMYIIKLTYYVFQLKRESKKLSYSQHSS